MLSRTWVLLGENFVIGLLRSDLAVSAVSLSVCSAEDSVCNSQCIELSVENKIKVELRHDGVESDCRQLKQDVLVARMVQGVRSTVL